MGGADEVAVWRDAELAVEDDALERAAAGEAGAVGERGVVGEDGADAGEDGVGGVAELLDFGAGGGAGEPMRLEFAVGAGLAAGGLGASMPSVERAALRVTKGRPRVMAKAKALLRARASASQTPTVTSMPAARRRARPRPETSGFGSTVATTQRAMRAAMSASAQGPVRPWCEQGSRVT